jgi:hypothetical protein
MARRISIALFCLAAVCSIAQGQIELAVTADITPHPDHLQVRVVVTNQGKEEARDVQIHLRDAGETTLPVRPSLPPGSTHEAGTELPTTARNPGRYPLFVTVGYADRNGYAFSAVLCALYSIGQETVSEIFGTLQTEPLADEANLELQLKNLAAQERTFNLTLFTPRDLTADPPQTVKLGPAEERRLSLTLRKFSALPGSRYPVYAVIEYDNDGRHFTNAVLGQVETVVPQGFFTRYRLWLLSLAAILGAAGIWAALRRRLAGH